MTRGRSNDQNARGPVGPDPDSVEDSVQEVGVGNSYSCDASSGYGNSSSGKFRAAGIGGFWHY